MNNQAIERAPRELPNALTVARQRISDCNPKISAGGMMVENASEALFAAELFIAGGHTGFKNPAEMAMAIIAGAALGMGADQAIQAFSVIKGKVCMYGDALPAQVRKTKELKAHTETPSGSIKDGTRAWTVEITRVQKLVNGEFGETTYRQTYSIDDAKTAGLWGAKDNWKNYPDRMLQMRARAFCIRDAFADALKGVAVVEEVEDYAPARKPSNTAPREVDGSRAKGLGATLLGRGESEPSEPEQAAETTPEPENEPIDTEAAEIVDEPETQPMDAEQSDSTNPLDGAPFDAEFFDELPDG